MATENLERPQQARNDNGQAGNVKNGESPKTVDELLLKVRSVLAETDVAAETIATLARQS
jgi:hypothetical protein